VPFRDAGVSTWDMKKNARFLATVGLLLAVLVAGPSVTSAGAETDGKAKLTASLLDKKVKANDKARMKGELEVEDAGGRSLTPIVVQKLVAGVWVNVYTTDCRPNYTFRLSVSFSVAAQYSLRVYHPSTTVYSNVMLLTVI
jgi:hypothetical protein